MQCTTQNAAVSGGGGGEVTIRTMEDILAYIQKKNPDLVPFDYEGQQYILYQEFYMAVCNVSKDTARTAKNRLFKNYPDLEGTVIKTMPNISEYCSPNTGTIQSY
jgi:hypothetical protein